jgi:hypothetical protein
VVHAIVTSGEGNATATPIWLDRDLAAWSGLVAAGSLVFGAQVTMAAAQAVHSCDGGNVIRGIAAVSGLPASLLCSFLAITVQSKSVLRRVFLGLQVAFLLVSIPCAALTFRYTETSVSQHPVCVISQAQ